MAPDSAPGGGSLSGRSLSRTIGLPLQTSEEGVGGTYILSTVPGDRPEFIGLVLDASSSRASLLPDRFETLKGLINTATRFPDLPLHINVKELRAVRLVCMAFRSHLEDRVVRVLMDNTVSMFYINMQAATLKFLAVLLAAGMLAFLGAIICIIASVHPAASPAGALRGADNDSSAAAALLPASAADKGPGALHGAGQSFSGGPQDSLLELLSSSARPRQQQHHQQLFSRFLCTPLPAECPSDSPPPGDGPAPAEDLFFLHAAAEQLRQTALQQKDQILSDQETIRELTGKLSQCESGLELSFQDSASLWGGPRKDTMGDLPWDSPAMVQELEDAVRSLKDRIDKIEQELPARANISTSSSPVLTRDVLHTKMEEIEEQLLSKILSLEKERSSVTSNNDQQQQEVEKELSVLQSRVSELEQGAPDFNPPDAYKVTIPVRTNYMYARMKKSLPELFSFTVCMWLKSKASSGLGTPFSYSAPGQANEIVLMEWGHNPMELLINDKVAQLPLNLKDGTWHHICIAWTTRDGVWWAYEDGEQRGSSENLAAWHPIKPHGVIILGQEQDTLGGRFDATQAFVGEIAQFNIWDHILTPTEILGLANCTSHLQGNVIQWDDELVEVLGGATKWSFEMCEERMKA
ncbi:neuronal pentraxin receptor [Terrapene carolina triunguis]|uniref:neuronal pentraxin receptor n=1 Tax=Terrapene triunguis TaxID=2587831 RepID=UPI0011567FC6|nr:neuronal pentraxin receptor [Terrapene carolina triunguis]